MNPLFWFGIRGRYISKENVQMYYHNALDIRCLSSFCPTSLLDGVKKHEGRRSRLGVITDQCVALVSKGTTPQQSRLVGDALESCDSQTSTESCSESSESSPNELTLLNDVSVHLQIIVS